MVDLLDGAHAGRGDDRPAGGPVVAQQGIVCERGRGDLPAWRVECLDEIDGALVPRGREPRDTAFPAVCVDRCVRVLVELESALEIAVRVAERVLARAV